MDARAELTDVIVKCKTKVVDEGHERALADAIVDGLDRKGIVLAELADVFDPPDEHLRTMKNIRRIITEALNSDPSGRDMASLSRQLQQISKEVVAVEERRRADNKSDKGTRTKKGTTNGAVTHTKGTAKSGPLNL